MPIIMGDLTRCEEVEIAVTVKIAPGQVAFSERHEPPICGRCEDAISVDVGQQKGVAGAVGPHERHVDVPVSFNISPVHG